MYTDEQILNLLKKDRNAGAKMLVEQYSSLLSSICAKKLQNPEDINECINDAFAEFFLRADQYSPAKGSLKNYLCAIADHKAVDLFRKNCHRTELEKDLLENHREEHRTQTTRLQESEQLDTAMTKLPALDRQILKMHYYDELSYKLFPRSKCRRIYSSDSLFVF